jgi:Tol biopolymer transport system component
MRRPALTAATAILGMTAVVGSPMLPSALLTVPQRDRGRSTRKPPSASITADGRYIALASYARLTPHDTDDRSDIYLLDRLTGTATLQSSSTDGITLDGVDCWFPRMSGDGRYILFESVIARPDIGPDVLLRDRVEHTTRRVSRNLVGRAPDGWSANGAISGDGRTIVFASTATDLVDGSDANGMQSDIYLFRTATGLIQRINLNARGVQPSTGASVAPSVSDDGRYVAFTSTAALVPLTGRQRPAAARRQGRPVSVVYLVDTSLNLVERIAPKDVEPNGSSFWPAISGNGRYVAFASHATNLVTGDRNDSPDVFLYERSTQSITLVSRGPGGRTANGVSGSPSISADGRLVVFQSDASDLTCPERCPPGVEDINLLPDVFVFDRASGITRWISRGSDGAWMEESVAPVLDAEGSIIAFASKHPIDASDVWNDFDLFVHVSNLR